MENLQQTDPTGLISQCIDQLIQVGFDASAFGMAKWVGVFCLVVLGVLVAVTFAVRARKDKDLPAALSDSQFRLIFLVGALMITLPVVAKITSEKINVDFGSQDRSFAYRVCEEQIDATADNAAFEAVTRQVAALSARVQQLEASAGTTLDPAHKSTALLGTALSVFNRSASKELALRIERMLEENGAGVAVRSTDLTESFWSDIGVTGDVYISYVNAASAAVAQVKVVLEAAGIDVKATREVQSLSGNPLQILVF